MEHELISLSNKINSANKSRRRGLRSLKANKKAGIVYVDELPPVGDTTSVFAYDAQTQQLYLNFDNRYWQTVNTRSMVVPTVQKKYINY